MKNLRRIELECMATSLSLWCCLMQTNVVLCLCSAQPSFWWWEVKVSIFMQRMPAACCTHIALCTCNEDTTYVWLFHTQRQHLRTCTVAQELLRKVCMREDSDRVSAL